MSIVDSVKEWFFKKALQKAIVRVATFAVSWFGAAVAKVELQK